MNTNPQFKKKLLKQGYTVKNDISGFLKSVVDSISGMSFKAAPFGITSKFAAYIQHQYSL